MLTLFSIAMFWLTKNGAAFVYTDEMAQKCRLHIYKGDHSYETVYLVDNEEEKPQERDSNTHFKIHLAIQAKSDAYISISSAMDPGPNDAEYRIVVGGDNNTNTQLIKLKQRKTDKTIICVETPGILSEVQLRGFYIKVTKDGVIKFSREGEIKPVILFKDIGPLNIQYIGFSGQMGIPVKYLFECPPPTERGSENSTMSYEENQEL